MFSSNTSQVAATATQAEAVDFDGTNDYLSRTSTLTGAANSKTFTLSFWFWAPLPSTDCTFYEEDTGSSYRFVVEWIVSSTTLRVYARNTSGTNILVANYQIALGALTNTFYHILFSADLSSTSNRYFYVNDEAVAPSYATYTNQEIGFANSTRYAVANDLINTGLLAKTRLSNFYRDNTYRNLSTTANRRLFVTADLKPAAGQAALNPILYLPMSDPTTVGTNAGTGGNFTLTGTVARSGRGPNQYNAPDSTFDGVNDFVYRATAPSGAANSTQLTLAYNIRPIGTTERVLVITSNLAGRQIWFNSNFTASTLTMSASNSSNVAVLGFSYSPAGGFIVGRNYNVVISLDLANTASRFVFVNGVNVTSSVSFSTYTNSAIGFGSTTYWSIASRVNPDFPSGNGSSNANFGALWFNTSYIDLSQPANLAKFVSGTGIDAKPVDLGATGELPTGTSPIIYLPMYGNNAGKNYGTGGDFTVNSGPFTGARGPNEFWSGAGLFNNPNQNEGNCLNLNNSPDVTGITKTTFACCFKRRDVTIADDSAIFNTTSSTNNNWHFAVMFGASEQLQILCNGAIIATVATAITDTNWHTLLVAFDSTITTAYVYLDGVSVPASIPTNKTYTQAFTWVGRANGVVADFSFDGNIGFIYQAHDYVNISLESNRLKFFDAFGYPVDLAAQVTAAAIPAPYIYLLFGDPSNLGANGGTAGNFTNSGVTASALVKA